MFAATFREYGGPEVMRWEEVALAPPGAGEARVRHTAIGINYSDINVRRGGFYLARPLRFPVVLGNEAAGVVESVGEGVTDVETADHRRDRIDRQRQCLSDHKGAGKTDQHGQIKWTAQGLPERHS